MIVSYKIRMCPNKTQIFKCDKMFGGCRFVYNQYLNYNIKAYENGEPFMKWTQYRKIIKEMRETYPWLKELNKHSLDFSAKRANTAFDRFFKHKSGYPHFKSKKYPVDSFYLDADEDKVCFYQNHIKIPYLGKVRVRNIEYVPKNNHIYGITVKKELNQYYIIFRIQVCSDDLDNSKYKNNIKNYGYGIDVGIKKYLTIADSNGSIFQFESFLNNPKITKLEKKIKYLQEKISNKMEINYNFLLSSYFDSHHEEPDENTKKIMKGESYSNTCVYLQNKITKIKIKIGRIKSDIINKIIIKMVKIKPEFITIETLDIKDMLENDSSKTLHRFIHDSRFGYFFNKLKFKCLIYNIELRQASKYFASSKKCCICGKKNKNLKLSDRIYRCDKCGNIVDRDVNASINLVNLNNYLVFNY